MFKKNSKVVYGQTGVCIIEDIVEKELIRNQKKFYYVLKPIYQQNSTIYAPVDNEKIPIREVISYEDANRLISDMPKIAKKAKETEVLETEKIITSNNSDDLAFIVAKIYNKKQNAKALKKKLGFMDEKFMRQAEGLLYGELAAVLNIPLDSVPSYIDERLNDE